MRIIVKIFVAFALLYVALVAGLAIAMRQPPDTFGAIMAKMPSLAFLLLPFKHLWMNARAGALEVGQSAPDFSLKTPDRSSTVRLASFRGKPVVLVFGSYT